MAEPRDEQPDELPEAPPARGKDTAVYVGLFLVIGVIATLGALFVLTDAAIFRGRYIVGTTVPDAGGIRRGDPVQMRGVNIGRVQRFEISDQGVTVRLEIEGEFKIPKDSYVQLEAAGLLGGMVANVVPGRAKETVGYGDMLTGRTEAGAMASTNQLAAKAEDVLVRVQEILTPGFKDDIHGSAGELQKALADLSATIGEQRTQIAAITASLRKSAHTTERALAGGELERTMKRLDTLSARMDEVTASLEKSSKSAEVVMARMQRGEGTLGKLSQDQTLYNNANITTENANKTIQNLNQLTNDMRALIADIKKNPKRYITLEVF
ncbi:MAG TPA: MlaD family protein [Vicinamibacteria bacterium]|jgi:phospholipid/cholesterol/gamma-HCH transport system substrate-binding protein